MTLTFRAATDEEYQTYRAGSHEHYMDQMVRLGGMSEAEGRAKAAEDLGLLLPEDELPAGHRLTVALEHGQVVGRVWVGPRRMGGEGEWVYDVSVDDRHRGRGFGRALMDEAERQARVAGSPSLGLNVFGGNTAAMGLYASLGYRVVAQEMVMEFDEPAGSDV